MRSSSSVGTADPDCGYGCDWGSDEHGSCRTALPDMLAAVG